MLRNTEAPPDTAASHRIGRDRDSTEVFDQDESIIAAERHIEGR